MTPFYPPNLIQVLLNAIRISIDEKFFYYILNGKTRLSGAIKRSIQQSGKMCISMPV